MQKELLLSSISIFLSNVNNMTGSDFNPKKFRHHSIYNERCSRIEMYLVSETEQNIKFEDMIIHLQKGEMILTEYSYKYSTGSFSELIKDIFVINKVWTDTNNNFAVILCSSNNK